MLPEYGRLADGRMIRYPVMGDAVASKLLNKLAVPSNQMMGSDWGLRTP